MIESFDEYVNLEVEIARALDTLKTFAPDSEEYAKIVKQLSELTKIRMSLSDATVKLFETTSAVDEARKSTVIKQDELELKYKEANKPDHVSKDTIALVGANLAGIVLILGYERMNIIASKALGLVMRLR